MHEDTHQVIGVTTSWNYAVKQEEDFLRAFRLNYIFTTLAAICLGEEIHYLTAGSSSRGSCGAGNFSQVGSTLHISRAYSAIVRSLENFPDEAML